MLIKAGVDISLLNRPIRKALNVIQRVYAEHGAGEIIITSTYEGNHSAGSLHYANDALDLRRPPSAVGVVATLKRELGSDFDVIDEGDHIHVEHDPKEELP